MSFVFELDSPSDEAGASFVARGGRALQKCVNDSGVAQQEIAERLGVTPSRISKALSGFNNLTLKTVGEIGWAAGYRPTLVFEPVAPPMDNVVPFPSPNSFVGTQLTSEQGATLSDDIFLQVGT